MIVTPRSPGTAVSEGILKMMQCDSVAQRQGSIDLPRRDTCLADRLPILRLAVLPEHLGHLLWDQFLFGLLVAPEDPLEEAHQSRFPSVRPDDF